VANTDNRVNIPHGTRQQLVSQYPDCVPEREQGMIRENGPDRLLSILVNHPILPLDPWSGFEVCALHDSFQRHATQ
jgi:hypothetical protein